VPGDLVDYMVRLGIYSNYPVYLGQVVKEMLASGYPVQRRSFRDFVMYLERSKGYEEDAKRFVTLAHETTNIQVNYELMQGMFQRTIRAKGGKDLLKLFEQFRKAIKLNKVG